VRHHTLTTAMLSLLIAGAVRPLQAQEAMPPAIGHRRVAVGLGFFFPQGLGMLGEAYFRRDRFSAVAVVATPFCVGCTEVPALDVGGGLRVFAGIPRIPYITVDEALNRVFLELYVGPLALRNNPFRFYDGIGVALGMEAGGGSTGLSAGWSVGRGSLFKKGKCTEIADTCPPAVLSFYLSWTAWR